MAVDLKPFQNYIHAIEKALAADDATEHTHRPALKVLFESLDTTIAATNEPKHIECGAPDFIIRKGSVTVGYVEAKDISKSLDEAEKTDRDDIPPILNDSYHKRENHLRKQLLLWRFRNMNLIDTRLLDTIDIGKVEPRLKQTGLPYALIFKDFS